MTGDLWFVLRPLKPEPVKLNPRGSAEVILLKHIAGNIYLVPWQQNRQLNSRNTRLARCRVLHRCRGTVCLWILLCVPMWGQMEHVTAEVTWMLKMPYFQEIFSKRNSIFTAYMGLWEMAKDTHKWMHIEYSEPETCLTRKTLSYDCSLSNARTKVTCCYLLSVWMERSAVMWYDTLFASHLQHSFPNLH